MGSSQQIPVVTQSDHKPFMPPAVSQLPPQPDLDWLSGNSTTKNQTTDFFAQSAQPEDTASGGSLTGSDEAQQATSLPTPPAGMPSPEPTSSTATASASEVPAAPANPPASNQPALPVLPEYQGPPAEELIYEWAGPSRPFKQRKRQYFTTVFTIALLICLILFFAGQFLPIAVVIAVAFLSYVMASIPPQQVLYRITTYGVRIEDAIYAWEELGRFWFADVYGQRVLHVEVDRFPFKLTVMVVEPAKEEELTELLAMVLLHERPLPTVYERAARWLQEKLPLDLES